MATPEQDWAPTANSVWVLGYQPFNAYSTAACPEHLVVDFYGKVAIAPATNGLSWQRTDGSSYFVARLSPNNYGGSGNYGDGSANPMTLHIGVTFTGPTLLTVTYTLVPNATPDCQHVYQYQGTKEW